MKNGLVVVLMLGGLVGASGCADDERDPLPTCESLGCTGELFCTTRTICQCPTDAGAETCEREPEPE